MHKESFIAIDAIINMFPERSQTEGLFTVYNKYTTVCVYACV